MPQFSLSLNLPLYFPLIFLLSLSTSFSLSFPLSLSFSQFIYSCFFTLFHSFFMSLPLAFSFSLFLFWHNFLTAFLIFSHSLLLHHNSNDRENLTSNQGLDSWIINYVFFCVIDNHNNMAQLNRVFWWTLFDYKLNWIILKLQTNFKVFPINKSIQQHLLKMS